MRKIMIKLENAYTSLLKETEERKNYSENLD